MKIYTVLDVKDAQPYVGHVCLFGHSISDIEEGTNFGILAYANTATTASHPYVKYGVEGNMTYALFVPAPEWDSILEKLKGMHALDKKIAGEYLLYLAEKEDEDEDDKDL